VKSCSICGSEYREQSAESVFAEAGEWLSEEIWDDAGELCTQCLENRARLVMMYHHDYNR
jgi:hypothetical protein